LAAAAALKRCTESRERADREHTTWRRPDLDECIVRGKGAHKRRRVRHDLNLDAHEESLVMEVHGVTAGA